MYPRCFFLAKCALIADWRATTASSRSVNSSSLSSCAMYLLRAACPRKAAWICVIAWRIRKNCKSKIVQEQWKVCEMCGGGPLFASTSAAFCTCKSAIGRMSKKEKPLPLVLILHPFVWSASEWKRQYWSKIWSWVLFNTILYFIATTPVGSNIVLAHHTKDKKKKKKKKKI